MPMQMMKGALRKTSITRLLSMSKAQVKSEHSVFQRYDNITVGAIIFKPSSTSTHELLLLKRASHDPAFPNMFAIPGGHVEDTDKDILHGLKREVLEETTMVVRDIIDQIDPLSWVTETNQTSVQLMFVCSVEGETFQVDPEEHSMGVWADREKAATLVMSTGMRRVVENAFKWKEATAKEKSRI